MGWLDRLVIPLGYTVRLATTDGFCSKDIDTVTTEVRSQARQIDASIFSRGRWTLEAVEAVEGNIKSIKHRERPSCFQ